MKKNVLYNKINKEELIVALSKEPFKRITASFYRYANVPEPINLRNELYIHWEKIKIFGRIYLAHEGINAQVSVPQHHWNDFISFNNQIKILKDIPIKKALKEGPSFFKLVIKVKDELVAFGLPEKTYDMNKIGKHLTAKDYNNALESPDSVVVDMRNFYESEVGHFDKAIIPKAETSRHLLPEVKQLLKGKEENKILLYCTGGIRCEKASSFLIKNGFKDVNQLQGGIIKYAHEIKKSGLKSKFRGKNFVFDNRLGERVTEDVIASCHTCGLPCDDHTDCKNQACHILFIQCKKCSKLYNGCCSKDCDDFASLPESEQRILRKDPKKVVAKEFFNPNSKA